MMYSLARGKWKHDPSCAVATIRDRAAPRLSHDQRSSDTDKKT